MIYRDCFITIFFISNIVFPSFLLAANQQEELIVSATRWETIATPTASNISVITREEIELSGAQSLTDVLRGRGGVQISDFYGDGSRPRVSIRGFGANSQSNALILMDGRRLNNTDLAAASLNTISLKDIERIEIIQGSSAVLFGDQAVGGVINIISREPQSLSLKMDLAIGSYAQQYQTIQAENRHENGVAYRISYQHNESDNFRDNNDRNYKNAFVELSYDFELGSAFIEYQNISEDISLPGAIFSAQVAQDRRQTRFPDDFNDTHTEIIRVGGNYTINNDWNFATEVTNRRANIVGILSNSNFVQERKNLSFNPRIKGQLGEISLVSGIDVEDVEYSLVAFGVTDTEQRIRSIYSQALIPVTDYFDITAGIRKAWYKNTITFDTFTFPNGTVFRDQQFVPSLGVTIRPNENWTIKVKAEENYRFPLADEETSVTAGLTSGLETQEGRSYEASLEWQNNVINTRLIAYRLNLTNEIDFNPATFVNVNLDPTSRSGLIYELNYLFSDNLSIDFQYTYTDAEFDKGNFAGNRIPFVAEHHGRIGLSYNVFEHLNLFAEVQAISERVASGDYANTSEKLSGYVLLNSNISYTYKGLSLSLRINNIFDKQYNDQAATAFNPFPTVETGFYPAPERNFLLGIRYTYQ